MNEAILISSAFLTSILSGILGTAGGLLLLIIMSSFFPPVILIPMHGVVQFASNSFRVFLYRKILDWKISGSFLFGGIIGGLLGSQVIVEIPEALYRLLIGVFILGLVWKTEVFKFLKIPDFEGLKVHPRFFVLGIIGSFLSLIFGAAGPFISPFFIRLGMRKEQMIGTKAACQLVGHVVKVVVFTSLGFALTDYVFLISTMVLAVLLGNWVGKLLLGKISEIFFMQFYKITITVLALRLVFKGIQGF